MKKFLFQEFILIMFFLFPLTCFAKPVITNQGPFIDSSRNANLTINFKTIDDEALPNTEFSIYKVADIKEYGIFNAINPFDSYDIDLEYLEDDDWNDLAIKLAKYVKNDRITTELSGKTNNDGILNFDKIDLGLYLVIGKPYVYGARTYTPQVFLISLPNMLEQDVWEYDVEVFPKYEYDLDESKIVNKKVEVSWDDKGHEKERPDSVIIELYKDGVKVDEVVLSDENDWEYIWEGLDDSFEWRVKDTTGNNKYNVTTTYKDGVFTVTYKYKDNILLPDTGMLWWPVPILFIIGLMLIIVGKIVGDKKNEE